MTKTPTAGMTLTTFTDSVGLTRRHWLSFAVITALLLCDGMDVTIVSHTFPSLVKEWGITVGGGITFIVTAGFISMGLGAIVAGRLADRIGRKSVIVASGMLLSVATALGALSNDFTAFATWRLIACLGMGAVMPMAMTLLADLVPAKRRSAMIAAAYAGVGLGTTVGAILAGILIPAGTWRALLVAGGVLPFVVVIALAVLVPESPAFYAARGSYDKARSVLARLAPHADLSELDLRPTPTSERAAAVISVIVSKRFVLTTVLLWAFGFFSLGTQLLIGQYLPILLQQPSPGLDTVQSSTIVGAYGLAGVAGGLLLGGFLARISRFTVIAIVLVLAAASAMVIGLLPDPRFGLLLPLFLIVGLILPTAFGPTRNVLAASAYPTRVRATGVGSTELSARLGSAAGGAVGGTLVGAGLGLSGLFLVVLIPIGVLLATLLGLRLDARRTGADSIVNSPGGHEAL